MTGHSEHFEAWAEKAGYATQRTFSGYVSPLTQCAWLAWQAGVGVMQEEIAALRAEKAALEKVAEATVAHLEIERITEPRGENPWLDEIENALREAGYLGGGK